MKKILLIITLIYLSTTSFSQNLRLGVEWGFPISIVSVSNADDFLKPSMLDFPENINLTINYSFGSNIFLKSGIGYSQYNKVIWEKDMLYNDFISGSQMDLYKSIIIPFQIGYKQKLFSSFYLKYASGIDLDFIFEKGQRYITYGGTMYDGQGNPISREDLFRQLGVEYNIGYPISACKRNFNVLLSQKLSLSYEIKKFMYIDLFCEYHAGLFKMVETTGMIRTIDENENIEYYYPVITSNGSYWRIGLEIGYIFRNK